MVNGFLLICLSFFAVLQRRYADELAKGAVEVTLVGEAEDAADVRLLHYDNMHILYAYFRDSFEIHKKTFEYYANSFCLYSNRIGKAICIGDKDPSPATIEKTPHYSVGCFFYLSDQRRT